jgi:tetratricopeptide (TPR) repeat protein
MDHRNRNVLRRAFSGSAGMMPALRGILPRTRESAFANSQVALRCRALLKPPGNVPSEASRLLALPVFYRVTLVRVMAAGFCASLFLSAFAESDSQFAKANQQYAQGHFKQAISTYESIVRAGHWSANLFYDLGNAYFRTGDFGRAILNYERALSVERRHPEANANLQIARDEAGALELQPAWPERYLRFASIDQYSVAAAVAFWVAIFCILALIFARRRRGSAIALLIFSLLVFAVSVFAIYQLDRGNKGRALAIVTGKDVQARLATADTANSVLALPPGSEIKILSARGDWIYAALPNNLRGWIPARDAERVRL